MCRQRRDSIGFPESWATGMDDRQVDAGWERKKEKKKREWKAEKAVVCLTGCGPLSSVPAAPTAYSS